MFEGTNTLSRNKKALSVVVATAFVVVLVVALVAGSGQATAGSEPANKVAVSGSTVEEHAPNEEVTLLKTSMRNAAAKSLVLQVTLECSILTDLKTVGNTEQPARAESTLDVWVEIDGNTVPVADEGDGEVTFCNREYQRDTSNFDDEDATIDDHIRTKQAHGFNWMALRPGNGVKEIEVKGRLQTDPASPTDEATATLTVGNRTLIVEPVQAAHDETKSN